jgi:uncharacterized protein (TIGR02246 family)
MAAAPSTSVTSSGTLLTWDEYFDADDPEAMRTSFDEALADTAERLVARFGGRLVERYAGDLGPRPSTDPERTVARLAEAMNRGDLAAAAALYEPEAALVSRPDQVVRGTQGIREALHGFIALRPTLATSTSRVIESDGLVLYLGRWSLTGVGPDGGVVRMSGESSDVLRRQDDGRWLVALDNPWGAGLLQVSG